MNFDDDLPVLLRHLHLGDFIVKFSERVPHVHEGFAAYWTLVHPRIKQLVEAGWMDEVPTFSWLAWLRAREELFEADRAAPTHDAFSTLMGLLAIDRETTFTDAAVEVIFLQPNSANPAGIAVVDLLGCVIVDKDTHGTEVHPKDCFTPLALEGRRLFYSARSAFHLLNGMSVHLVGNLEVGFSFILGVVMAKPAGEVG